MIYKEGLWKVSELQNTIKSQALCCRFISSNPLNSLQEGNHLPHLTPQETKAQRG